MMALIQSFLASLKTWSFLFSLVYRTGAVSWTSPHDGVPGNWITH
jgi:hypothetical protein